jgi:hypothetical protein
MNEEILKKLKDLLRMAEGKASAEEAATAAAIAQKLITKYQIDLSVLEDKEDIKKAPPLYCSQRVSHWRSDLAYWICNLNGCVMYHAQYNDGNVGLGIVGRPTDSVFVRWLFAHCCNEIDRLCAEAMGRGDGAGKTWSNSFRHGAVNILIHRLKKAQEEQVQASSCTAMVKLDSRQEVVNQWIVKNMDLKHSKDHSTRSFNATAYIAGQEAGNKIVLNRPLEAKH